MQLSVKLRADTMRCVTIAAPPVVSSQVATSCSGYVVGVVCQDDLIPRASLANFEDLRKEIIACNWSEKLKAEVRAQHEVPTWGLGLGTQLGIRLMKMP